MMDTTDVTQGIFTWLMPEGSATGCYRVAGTMLRRLAEGRPIPVSEGASILGCREDELDARLAEMRICAERDDQGAIVGAGLSLRPTRHRFTIGDNELFTWCALDTLAFPLVLDRTALVESSCAATGRSISLTVSPHGLSNVDPPDAVVSVVVPGRDACNDVRQAFCAHSNFFASADAAGPWARENAAGTILTLDNAFAMACRLAPLLYAMDT
jgi:alkylmercury lyase